MKVLIISGGEITSDDFLEGILAAYCPDTLIAADSGANTLYRCGIIPDILTGDFDSIDERVYVYFKDKCEVITYKPQKDETDTELAIFKAKEIGATEMLLLGVTGSSLDHSFANLYLLNKADTLGIPCTICTETQQIFLIKSYKEFVGFKNIRLSLFPFSETAEGIKTQGFAYPLNDETLRFGDVRGISNIIAEENASVRVQQGKLIAFLDATYNTQNRI